MDRIQHNLLPLLPSGGKATELPRSVASSDRAPDFREDLRREVTRGHAERAGGDKRVSHAARPAARSSLNEDHSGNDKRAEKTVDDGGPLTEAEETKSAQGGENTTTDEAAFSDAASTDTEGGESAPNEGGEEHEPVEAAPQEVSAELQIAITPPVQGPSAENTTASELPTPLAPADGQVTTPPGSAIPVESSPTAVSVEETTSVGTEVSPHVVASPLHRSSKARESDPSDEDSGPNQSAGAEPGPIEIAEELTSKVASADDRVLDSNSGEQAAPDAELLQHNDADEPNIAGKAPEVDTRLESPENPSLEPRSSETRTTPIATHRVVAGSLQGSARAIPDEPPTPQVDPSRFVSRVSRAFEAANLRGGAVQLRLSPPELGAMRVELSVQQGVLSAHLETETAAAKSVLIDNLPALRERLAALDIRVERFDIDVRQESTGGQPDWQAQQESRDQGHQGPKGGMTRTRQLSTLDAPIEAVRPHSPLDSAGRFNAIA